MLKLPCLFVNKNELSLSSSSFSLESRLACELVVHELTGGNCANDAGEVGFLRLEPASEKNCESREQAGPQNIAAFRMCVWAAGLAERQLRVLKWVPVCSESDAE